jgi:hypothetical protein
MRFENPGTQIKSDASHTQISADQVPRCGAQRLRLKDFRFRFQVYTRKDQNQHPWVSPPTDDLLYVKS